MDDNIALIHQSVEYKIKIRDFQLKIDQDIDDIIKYFEFLQNPNKKSLSQCQKKSAQQYIFDQIDWHSVFKDIEIEVIKNYRKDGLYDNQQSLFYYFEILQKKDQKSYLLAKEFCKLQQKLTRGVINGVKLIIQKTNDEIENYCIKISTEGVNMIYMVAQTYLNRLIELLDIIDVYEPMRILQERQDREKKIFVAKLTNNNSKLDQALGEKFGFEMVQQFFKDAKQFAKEKFKGNMDSKKDEFEKINTINELENQCEDLYETIQVDPDYEFDEDDKKCMDEIIKFYKSPKALLEEKFKIKFENLSKQFIVESQQAFKDNFSHRIKQLKDFLNEFNNEILKKQIDKTASDLFSFHPSSRLQKDEIQNFQQFQMMALTNYFLEMINKDFHKDKIFKFENDQICLQQNRNVNMPIPIDINVNLDHLTTIKINNIISENDQIYQLHRFISHALRTIDEKSNSNNFDELMNVEESDSDQNQIPQNNPQEQKRESEIINEQELIGEYLQMFKQIFMGCFEHCPLCRRQCDINHNEIEGENEIVHQCQNGHQLQGFGGNKTFGDNKALLFSCNEIRENDEVIYKGNDMKWSNFKQEFQNWNFDVPPLNLQVIRQKNVRIWNLVGEKLCQKFIDEGLQIKFEQAEFQQQFGAQKLHYIMMLDSSGSMCGGNWNSLIQSFNDFNQQLCSKESFKENVKISVITYDSQSKICIRQQEPQDNLSHQIQYKGGGTDFDSPLRDALTLSQENAKDFDKIILYFMSDGEASYPNQGIGNFLNEAEIIKKIDFHAVYFGTGQSNPILKQMADAFPNGKLSGAPTAEALRDTFLKLVPNIYQ